MKVNTCIYAILKQTIIVFHGKIYICAFPLIHMLKHFQCTIVITTFLEQSREICLDYCIWSAAELFQKVPDQHTCSRLPIPQLA